MGLRDEVVCTLNRLQHISLPILPNGGSQSMLLIEFKIAAYGTFYLFFLSVLCDWARGKHSTLSHLLACHVSPFTHALMSASIFFHGTIRLLWCFHHNSTLLFFFLAIEVLSMSFCTSCDTHHVPEIACHYASCVTGNVFSALFFIVSLTYTKNIKEYLSQCLLYTLAGFYLLLIAVMWIVVVFVDGVMASVVEVSFLAMTVVLDAWGLHIMRNDNFSPVSSFL
jgi:hypothetical protein